MRPIEEPTGCGGLFTLLSSGPRKSTWRLGEPKAGGPWLSFAPRTARCCPSPWRCSTAPGRATHGPGSPGNMEGSGHPQLQACSSTSVPLRGEMREGLHGAGESWKRLPTSSPFGATSTQVTPTPLNQLMPVPGKRLGLRHAGGVVLSHGFRRWACCVTSGESRPSLRLSFLSVERSGSSAWTLFPWTLGS